MARKKYDFSDKDLIGTIEGLIRDGWDNKQVAEYLHYNEQYFCKVIKNNGELSEAIRRARKPITFAIENSLIKKCMGMKVKTISRRRVEKACNCDGDPDCSNCCGTGRYAVPGSEVVIETEQELPPDGRLIQFYLSQRKPEIYNKQPQKIDATTNGKDINSNIVIEIINSVDQIKKDDTSG